MKDYLKFLSRNKLYTAIEAAGLIVSLAFVLLTGHYVWKQRQMTRNVPDYQDVYSFYRSTDGNSGIGQSWGLAYQAKESIPEVEKSAMFWRALAPEENTVEINGSKHHVREFMVGGDFFDIFPAVFESGDAGVMGDISNVIISRSFANRLGGEEKAIGSIIDGRYTIAAIIRETPNPIFGDVDVIYNIENLASRKNAPFRLDVIPFVKVRKGTDRGMLEVKADTLVAKGFDAFGGRSFLEDSGLVRYDEIWFSPANNQSLKKGSRTYTGIILLVTIILLLSAIFNYINLNVVLSANIPYRAFCKGFLVKSGPKNVPKNEKLKKIKVLAGRHLSMKEKERGCRNFTSSKRDCSLPIFFPITKGHSILIVGKHLNSYYPSSVSFFL